MISPSQQTIARSFTITGIGLHSGHNIKMRLKPADADTGISFFRTDFDLTRKIQLSPFNIEKAVMCTLLVSPHDHGISISTIEHLLSALCILGIDNIIIEVDGSEIPVMDGSSAPFISALKHIGIKKLKKMRKYVKVLKKITVQEKEKFAEVLPAENTYYRFEIKWNHPTISKTPATTEFRGSVKDYCDNISKARTFGFVEQLDYLHRQGLAKGASLANTIGITSDGVANPEGLRYPDEFVKHKLLDAIGDFYAGGPVIGHFNCYKSGHALNNQLLRALYKDKTAWCYLPMITPQKS